jgi:acyl carrier protein
LRDLIIKTISKVFEVPTAQINDDSSPRTTASWDSLNHMKLILALEEEFGIMFSDEQIIELLTVRKIIAALENLVAEAGMYR